ncbi:MAG TPA: NAD-glutamate dehydrogenase [Steroidobacteraceae bacterium]|nr:NAD-glutamate dehydrogenase [Steroidobacteraceae bacterium]
MSAEIPAVRVRLIDRIVLAAGGPARKAGATDDGSFLRRYFMGVAQEDLAARDPSYLARIALAHRRAGERRPPGRPLVSVLDAQLTDDARGADRPGAHTLVAVVTDDMPFLVDSLFLAFNRLGIGVHLIIHPLFEVRRDRAGRLLSMADGSAARRESWQLFEVDRQIDPQRLRLLTRTLAATLADVRVAVADWRPMLEQARVAARELQDPGVPPESDPTEAQALIEWMVAGHFTFLGYRRYRLQRGARKDLLLPQSASGLGILRAARPGVATPAPTALTGALRREARSARAVLVTKANSRATVHRGSYLDYVGVRIFDARGRVTGEHRFLGLWTSSAYESSPRSIPMLKDKIEAVVGAFNAAPHSHDAKALLHVLETYPRDELFQATIPELIRNVRGIVNLYERAQVRLFARRDPFDRFYSCLVYVPRDRYDSRVRSRIEAVLLGEFGGEAVETQVQLSESTLARLYVVVRLGDRPRLRTDPARIERALARAASTWQAGLRDALTSGMDEAAALVLWSQFAGVFPAAYTEQVSPAAALADIAELVALGPEPGAMRLRLHRAAGEADTQLHLTLFRRGAAVSISDVVPVMENFGLRVIAEQPYEIRWPADTPVRIQDFELAHATPFDIGRLGGKLTAAIECVWTGLSENDGFNRLLPLTGLGVREIMVLRACGRYLLQTGLPFSQAYMERVLQANPRLARRLFELFERQLNPARSPAARARIQPLEDAIARDLEAVTSLDADRILRAFLHVIRAIVRTNFWQTVDGASRPCLSLKLDSHAIPELPLPRPLFEVFVYSPEVEAIHLRMAQVARGGIRWSDRREDFRTEVLGLMKAQNVKNTVIVPMGAKGGFVVKRPQATTAADRQREGIRCYQLFMRGLLDITDNIVNLQVVPPRQVTRRDPDDPYLVVAADKGTASFSDIANAISAEYSFWLGDAFASGGSAGYDHKKMGITARGAWESVKRHFRELGRDIQAEDFTVCGIGDMSGDVFGNGMLLSKHIRLVAAFDHRHIFLDPAPDPAASFAERQRLFALPASSWDDYSRKLISRGGGVFPRGAKSIALSGEARALLGLTGAAATPLEVIRAILMMPVDLLWNGGIGTYVKATNETHAQIGDRSNDALRINGAELRARVVGEGGNLGLSQQGRIEYALQGGRLNTDFIDNSAGVNTSDVEVNLKILLNPQVAAGKLALKARDRLLTRMTADVAALVLRNNYLQSQALSILEAQAVARLPEHQHLMRQLEHSGDLNRRIEFLPDDEAVAQRHKQSRGLTRPELAVLLSYGKIWLSHHLVQSDVPEDPYLSQELERYFPEAVRGRFARAIGRHRLRREIIATATTNSLVNRMGPAFVNRAQEETGASPARVARAYTAAREVFETRDLWAHIEGLDNRVPAEIQYAMLNETSRLLRHLSYWLLKYRQDLSIDAAVGKLRGSVRTLTAHLAEALAGQWRSNYLAVLARYTDARVPHPLAKRLALLDAQNCTLDIVELAAGAKVPVTDAAHVYFGLGARLGLDWIHAQVEALQIDGNWQVVARTGLRDSLYQSHRALAHKALALARRGSPAARIDAWISASARDLAQWERMQADMRAAGAADFATLSVGIEALRRLAV